MSNVIVQEALRGKVYKEMPSRNLDGSDAYARLGSRGEVMGIPLTCTKHGLAEEGSYYVATNATISTPITLTGATCTAWVATTPTVVLVNAHTTANVIPDYIKFHIVGAGTAEAALHYAILLDRANRYTSGGTAIVPSNVNTGISTSTSSLLYVGAITAPAASANVRQVGRGLFRNAIAVANDQYILSFGASDVAASAPQLASTTSIMQTFPAPPVVVSPGSSLLVYLWGASMSAAPTAEFEMGFWER
jgi:hypothetical protein